MPPKHNPKLPIIGFTLDHETNGSYSKMPFYAIRENYCTSVSTLGAIPMPLVHEVELVDHFLNLIDGLVIIGGAFDIHPSLYGVSDMHSTVTLKEKRTQFEWAITKQAVERDVPVLGICGGEQLLNVVLGGTLFQHVPESFPDSIILHEQPNPRTEPGHNIAIEKGTLLHKIVGSTTLSVNSAHHQAVAKAAPSLVVNATADDGVIEGIEYPGKRFCLGVQWHPEYTVNSGDKKIFEAFVSACQK